MENEINKSYRIRTDINKDSNVLVNFTQEYETFELLSIKMKTENLYRLHNANYGVVVGRVQANGGFGVPNAKISIFIEVDQDNENAELLAIYGYTDVFQTNSLGNTYNLLPDEQVSDCHKKIGAFPSKRYLLDNDTYIEVYDKYYKYTTRTNNAGDYIIVGVPVGNQTLHMDLDLSDCGILSQRPRDFVYKGYNIEQFDNPNQFKSETGASINFLSQYVQQTKTVYVTPLWGNNELGETIGITRADVDVNFKFEPTCVFMGSVVSDSKSNGISKKCVPTDQMGVMDELTTGKGTIEMIRKTPTGEVEEFQIKGNELIDGNGTWCYQIPMNLDYVTTNEYGETVATDNPNIGIPTRARVRFRVSLDNFEDSNDNYFAGKVLVPNNPKVVKNEVAYDYAFGTNTEDDSYRDLFWNNVYSVKQHIPRIQKSGSWRTDRFTGIKQCNFYGQNNPIPYNSIRIKLPFMFVVLCALIKTYVRIVAFLNAVLNAFFQVLVGFLWVMIIFIGALTPVLCILYGILWVIDKIVRALTFGSKHLNLSGLKSMCTMDVKNWPMVKRIKSVGYITIADGICPDLESWYFAPALLGRGVGYCPEQYFSITKETYNLCSQTVDKLVNEASSVEDGTSTDATNKDSGVEEKICITRNIDYLMTCIEMNLAQEYKVIKFDFYNDWINGMLYIPRWKFRPEHKITFLFGLIKFKIKTKGCFDDNSIFGRTRWLTQHCALGYKQSSFSGGYIGYSKIGTQNGCSSNKNKQKCHKSPGIRHTAVLGENGGIIHQEKTMVGQTVYYYKPSEMSLNKSGAKTKINMFATDIILLGSLKDCDENGVPQSFKWLSSSSYKMPTNLALTNLDEAGVLFVDKDSYCKGGTNNDIDNKKVSVADNSFKGQIDWSSNAPAEIQIMGYGSGLNSVENIVHIANDKIALTEAAGISWDYTGPSQAERGGNDLFSPGGHFLGMSCINSRTNIKSCVNLQRICEAGATMSERIEKTRGLKIGKDGTYKQQSVVFSPNGLISTDEIIAGSFRSMFATMNINPLIATKKDENTGYLTYDFKYLRANGFEGGAQSGVVSKSSNYNSSLSAIIHAQEPVYDEVNYSVEDIDEEEYDNTYHRSIEATNFGYYRFRFGLRNSDYKQFNSDAALKYGLTQGGLKYLPQYENSFYFYFGLKDGNTALDRLYSDFFSMCPTKQLTKKPSVKIKDAGIDYCTREQSIWVTCENIEYPYEIVLKNGSTVITAPNVTYKSANICGLAPGEWTITVTDSEGLSINKKVKVGSNIKGIDYNLNDFKEQLEGYYSLDAATSRLVDASRNHPKGGELKFNYDDITVFGSTIKKFVESNTGITNVGLLFVSSTSGSSSVPNYAIFAKYTDGAFTCEAFDSRKFYNSSVMKQGEPNRHKTDFEFSSSINIESIKETAANFGVDDACLYLWGDNMYYSLYFVYDSCGSNMYCALELCKFYSYGYSAFNVYLGSKYLKYNGKNAENFSLSTFLSGKSINEISDYSNMISTINLCGGSKAYTTQWALRQALFDLRYDITEDSSDRLIRCTNLNGDYVDAFLFGQPEKATTSEDGIKYEAFPDGLLNGINLPFSSNDYSSFAGYDIDDTASLLPSIGCALDDTVKLPYFRMTYDSETNMILSKPICEITITGVEDSEGGKFVSLKYIRNSGTGTTSQGKAYLLQDKANKGTVIECSCGAYNELLVAKDTWVKKEITIGSSGVTVDVMPTLAVPIIHKPFYFESYPFILGQFTAIGKSSLSMDFNESGSNTESTVIDGISYTYTALTYGDRQLKYKLERYSDDENKVVINDYIKIYGGNAVGPKYLLSEKCKHFGVDLREPMTLVTPSSAVTVAGGGGGVSMRSARRAPVSSSATASITTTVTSHVATGDPISIADNITGNTIDSKVERICKATIVQPDFLEISLTTGTPDLKKIKKNDANSYEDLMAFANNDEKNLEVTTSYNIDNYLPKEIVIRKKQIKDESDDETALIREDKYLDVGEMDNVTAADVNKYVKLYMVIMPDNGKSSKIDNAMGTCIFSDDMLTRKVGSTTEDRYLLFNKPNASYPGYPLYNTNGMKKTARELLSSVTFSDYFSNPKAVAFLFDQIINASFFSLMKAVHYYDDDAFIGKMAGGYFHKPDFNNYKDPGLMFGKIEVMYTPYREFVYKPISMINNSNFIPKKANLKSSNPWIVATVSGGGVNDYASIKCCLSSSSFTHSSMSNKSLLDYLKDSNLYKSMSRFGFDLSVVTKFNESDETNYPTYDDGTGKGNGKVNDSYINGLSEKLGFDSSVASISNFSASTGALEVDTFDKIIGRNWAFPNIEYKASGTANSATYDSFSKKIMDEYKRVKAINEGKGEDDELETPNYAKIIAEFFINSTFTSNKEESDTLNDLYALAKTSNQHEAFIVPIVLGENRDENGVLQSSFVWPGDKSYYKVQRDKRWVVNKDTVYALGHSSSSKVLSTVEDSIYDENLSYGFRSVIIGIYDGPEDGFNCMRDTDGKTGNLIRPFKIYTFHSKGLISDANEDSKIDNSHYIDDDFRPNDYYNNREDSGTGKRRKENLGLYYYHTYENDYDQYASGWC
jgi:hypothetical protein